MKKTADWRLAPAIGISLALHALAFAMVSSLLRAGGAETIGRQKYLSLHANLVSPFQHDAGQLEARPALPGRKLGAVSSPVAAADEAPMAGARNAQGGSPVPVNEPGQEAQVAANPRYRSAFAFSFPQVMMGGENDKEMHRQDDFQTERYYRGMMEAQAMRNRQEALRQRIARFHHLVNESLRDEEVLEGACRFAGGAQLECEPVSLKESLKESASRIAGLLASIQALGGRVDGFSISRQDGRVTVSLLEAGKQDIPASP